MYAKIIKDELSDGEVIKDRTGEVVLGEEPGPSPESCMTVRLLDDDRIPYYVCLVDDDPTMERLFEYMASDVGTTILQIRDDLNNEWSDVMS